MRSPRPARARAALLLGALLLAALLLAAPGRLAFAQDKGLPEAGLVRLEFRNAQVSDVLRLLAEVSPLNVVASEAAGKKRVSLYLQEVTPRLALETICKTSGLWFREDPGGRTIRVLTTEEYQKDLVVYREDRIQVFTLLHPNAIAIARVVENTFRDRVRLSLGVVEDVTGLQTYGNNPLLSSIGQSGTTGSNGTGAGAGAFGTGFGSGFGAGRTGQGLGGQGYGSGYGSGQTGLPGTAGTGAGPATGRDSPNLVDEKLTPDQIAELERRRAEKTGDALPGEDLRGIVRREPPIYVSVNAPANVIVVRTSDDRAMTAIESLVKELDRPTPQVLLEMKILELDLQDDFQSVFDFDYVEPVRARAGNSIGGKNNPFLAAGATAPTNVVGAGNFNLNPASSLVYQFLNDRIRARIQLLQTENRINVLSTPLLLCVNHGAAQIFVGEQRPITTGTQPESVAVTTGNSTFTQTVAVPVTTTVNVGNTLVLVPQINADRTVTLTIAQQSSSANPGAASVPVAVTSQNQIGIQSVAVDTLSSKQIAGTVVGKDGLTIAFGGLIEDRIERHESKIPFLGDVPLLGVFFRSTDRVRSRKELVLLVTPRVLFTPAEAQGVSRERLLGLSIHPYQDKGDRAARAYEKHEVPQAERAHVFLRDLLGADPEPAGK